MQNPWGDELLQLEQRVDGEELNISMLAEAG
jgi:hypothetical protein